MAVTRACLSLVFFLAAGPVAAQRVVSMAPALTEIVFALGKGHTLVGVSRFCDFPAQARTIAKVGGLFDVNVEALLALDPEIVIAYPEHRQQIKILSPRVRLQVVKHDRLSDLFAAVTRIGKVLRAEREAQNMVRELERSLAAVRAQVAGKKKVRCLIIAGRDRDELKNMYIIGNRDFLDELLQIAGGVNAYQGDVPYPSISLETVVFLNPDVIIELSAHYEGIGDERIYELWRPLTMLFAVRDRRLIIVRETFWLRPGPRVGAIAAAMARLLVPAGNKNEAPATATP